MSNYQDVFGTYTTPPSEYGYQSLTLTADATLYWPYNYSGTGYTVAKWNDVSAAAPQSITLPDATQVSTGEDFVISNVGAGLLTVKDAGGNTLTTVANGIAEYFILTSNSTTAGTYSHTTYGAGTSTATAGSLVGAGHRANGALIDNIIQATSIADGYTVVASDNANALIYGGGASAINLPVTTTLFNGFHVFVANDGTGTAVLTPNGVETIDGSSTKSLQPGESCIVTTTAAGAWYTIGYGRSNTYVWSKLVKTVDDTNAVTINSTEAAAKLWYFQPGAPAQTAIATVTIPAIESVYYVTVSACPYALTFTTGSGATATISPNTSAIITCDGVNVAPAQTATSASSLSLAAGSVTSPSLNFGGTGTGGDSDTGLYWLASGQIGVASNGAIAFSFSSTAMTLYHPLTPNNSTTGFESLINLGERTSQTGSVRLPASTTGDRDGSPYSGYIRFNTTENLLDYYNGTTWRFLTAATGSTGSTVLISGTTAQRDGSPAAGYARFNTSYAKAEVYNGTSWTGLGGATGGGGDDVFYENSQTVTSNYTITSGKNAMTAGPVTINSGVTVTVPSGSVWTVV